MRIALYSDLHIEHGQPFEPPSDLNADLVVLAGDIGSKTHGVKWAEQTFGSGRTIYVPGNHEYYGAHLGLLREMRKVGEMIGVHVLNNASAVVDDVRILGTTLWTNFMLNGPDRHASARRRARDDINDFSSIFVRSRDKLDPPRTQTLDPADAVNLYRTAITFLRSELAKPWSGKTLVVTHFAPHRGCIAQEYMGNDLTAYFVVDMAWMMSEFRIDVWAHGHTHTNTDFIAENGCRVVSNQRGYPIEQSIGFRPDLVIEV